MHIRTLVSRLAVGVALALTVAPLGGQTSQLGQWSAVFSMPLVAVHAALMRTGELLLFDAWEIPGTPSARLWNPETNAYTPVPNGFAELFCAGHILTSDGRLLTAGGHNGPASARPTPRCSTLHATVDLSGRPQLRALVSVPGPARRRPALTLGGAISRPNNAESRKRSRSGHQRGRRCRPRRRTSASIRCCPWPRRPGLRERLRRRPPLWLFDLGADTGSRSASVRPPAAPG